MKLAAVAESHLLELMRWFPDKRTCTVWSGPEFRYPFTEATFREDVRLQLPSYSLISDYGELLGFGQYYLRAERCHLARLVIAPHHRGRSVGAFLIRELSRRGCSELGVGNCSLFVLESNAPAVRLYSRLGFHTTAYPGDAPPIEGVVYMVATAEQINGGNVVAQQSHQHGRPCAMLLRRIVHGRRLWQALGNTRTHVSWTSGEYRLEEGSQCVNLDTVHELLRRSYWASSRTREEIARTVEHSTCFSLFHGDAQVGFFRALSDRGAYTYLMDFVVSEQHQGNGIGSWALAVILNHPPFAGTRFILVTKDAQAFYRKAGFETHPFECMIKR